MAKTRGIYIKVGGSTWQTMPRKTLPPRPCRMLQLALVQIEIMWLSVKLRAVLYWTLSLHAASRQIRPELTRG